jgi:hypothetical protein
MEPVKRNKKISVRALFDLAMGLIYSVVGGLLVISKSIGLNITFPPQDVITVFGVLCLLYGLFRIFRGYKTFYSE